MKALKRARADLKKAIAKRDKTKEQLQQDELTVKECQAAVYEAENNEYIGMIRELSVSVEEFGQIKEQLKKGSLASVIAAREENTEDDEHVEWEA